ncbi:MAG: leucine-rich repeat protein [Clostridia bacterium]|nr:leucine-rich repeat protein [Clostridia bacterium]
MKHTKKPLAILMSIVLLLCAIPLMQASAQPYDDNLEHYQSGMWEYTLEDGKASITGLYPDEELSGTVSVPEALDGYPVTEIDWIYSSSEIVIYVPASIEFLNTSYGLFGGGISGVEIDENNPNYTTVDGVIYSKDEEVLVSYLPNGPETYTIPNGVTAIGANAFLWNESIIKIILPESLEIIGESAFEDCYVLETIVVNDNLKEILKYAFHGCYNLKSFDVPASLTSINEFVFNNCSFLQSINVSSENPVYSSEDGVLYNKDKTELIRCPEGKSLEEWNFPSSVTTIGHSGFYSCDMESIVISENIETIGKLAFSSCYFLENVKFAESSALETICEYAFSDCESIKALKLPEGLKSIMHCAFEWSGIERIYIPQSVQFVDIYAAQSSSLTDVYYAGTRAQWSDILKEDNDNFYYYDEYSEFEYADIHYYVHSAQGKCNNDISWQYDGMGTLTISGTGAMPSYPSGQGAPWNELANNIQVVEIEEGIASIDGFYNCSSLETIILPESLEYIESCTFCWDYYDTKEIIYKGMPEQWEKIEFGTHDSDGCFCYYIYGAIYIDNEDFVIDSLDILVEGSTTVKYGETACLHANIPITINEFYKDDLDDLPSDHGLLHDMYYYLYYFLPVGTRLNWYGTDDYGCFDWNSYSGEDYWFALTSMVSGSETVTVCLEDKDGYTIYNDDGEPIEASITLTSKAGIFEIIAYFFREMFRMFLSWFMF